MSDASPAHQRFLDWVDSYEAAWRTPGMASLAALFTSDATYRVSPYATPHVGLDEIERMWEAERDSPNEVFAMTREVVAVEGGTGVLRCVVRYGDPVEQEYTDLWVVRLEDDGRCSAYEEWAFWPSRPHTARER